MQGTGEVADLLVRPTQAIEPQLGAAASDVVEEAFVQVRHDCLVRVRRKLLLGIQEIADDVWPEGHAATAHATLHDSDKVLVHDQVPGTVQLQGSHVEPREAVLDDGTDRRFHETPSALSVRRGGEPWRKVRLDQDRRVNTAVPHVARPQTLAEQHLLIDGALGLEQRAEVPENRAVVHVDVTLNQRLVHLQEGNDLGQVEAVRVRMLRREPAVRQGEHGCPTPFRLCQALERGHVPERRLWEVLAFLQRLTRLDQAFQKRGPQRC